MRKVILPILIAAVFSTAKLAAQDQLWLASGDTLSGEIELLMPDKYYEEISFTNEEGKKRLKAFEFVGFSKDSVSYKSIKNNDIYQIMKLTKSGYLSLYEYRIEQGYSFAGRYLLRRDGFGLEVPNVGFKKRLAKFLEDCNSVSMGIQGNKYRKSDIKQIVDDYNACIETRTEELANAPAKAPTTSAENQNLVSMAQSVLADAKSAGDQELAAMLQDVVNKLAANESIPVYLKNALQDQVGEDNPLYSKVQDLLKNL